MEQHRPLRDKEQFDFAKLFYPDIKGATDIDFIYERNGQFLVIEFKETNLLNLKVSVSFGQFLALKKLWEKGFVVYYIFKHAPNYFTPVHMQTLKDKNYRYDDFNKAVVDIDLYQYTKCTLFQIKALVKTVCNDFESLNS